MPLLMAPPVYSGWLSVTEKSVAQMWKRRFLTVGEVAGRRKAVADVTYRQSGSYLRESGGTGDTHVTLGLPDSPEDRAKLSAAGLGDVEYFFNRHHLTLPVSCRSAAAQGCHQQPCEQSKIVHKVWLELYKKLLLSAKP